MTNKLRNLRVCFGLLLLELAACESIPSTPKATFKECSECPLMVVIPAGAVLMGSERAEQDWSVAQGRKREYTDRENPLHRVTFARSFSAGAFEVTLREFAVFVTETGHDASTGLCDTFEVVDGKMVRAKRAERDWQRVGHDQTDEHPVACVNWHDAMAYTAWLSRRTGSHYRLLSESEWEYVARAGTSTYRYWGDDPQDAELCRFANAADGTALPTGEQWPAASRCLDGFWATSPVGRFDANAFGIHDALGNVWEWVADCGHVNYEGAPTDGRAWEEASCEGRVLRGGAFHEGGGYVRAAVRGIAPPDLRYNNSGFRVARDF